ncbi:MAG TPA: hypothetical protein VKU60_19390, partial [Chloroflexota bacterium]|nr:hypothetical protein [Chloroflexota bacterium]
MPWVRTAPMHLALILGLSACGQAAAMRSGSPVPAVSPSAAQAASEASTKASSAANANLPALKLSPDKGLAGTPFTATLGGLRPGEDVAFEWGTWDGSYVTTPSPETVQYGKRAFTPKRMPLTSVKADGQGVA